MANGQKSLEEKRKQQADRIADSLKEQERRKEEIKFQEEWNKRIDIAREARVAYEGDDPVTAVVNYKKILSLTARRHGVPVEQLHPKLFDAKTRISEAILISAICLDLAKIVDRLEGEAAMKDLRLYLRLFVTFSKNMTFDVIATTTLRKHIQYTRGIKHRAVFEEAYSQLRKGSGTCFVATVAFGDADAAPVLELRRFRDEVLLDSPAGRAFIICYYKFGPTAASLVKNIPGARSAVRALIRLFLSRLKQF